MIPFLFGVTDDGTAVVWPVDRPAAIEAKAHSFMDRGGRYIITDATANHIRVAAVIEGHNRKAHELAAVLAIRGSSDDETIDRLVEDSIRLIAPVH